MAVYLWVEPSAPLAGWSSDSMACACHRAEQQGSIREQYTGLPTQACVMLTTYHKAVDKINIRPKRFRRMQNLGNNLI